MYALILSSFWSQVAQELGFGIERLTLDTGSCRERLVEAEICRQPVDERPPLK